MMIALNKWLKLRTDRRGITALEYALIAGAIGLVVLVGAGTLGTAVSGKLTAIGGSVTAAGK